MLLFGWQECDDTPFMENLIQHFLGGLYFLRLLNFDETVESIEVGSVCGLLMIMIK